MSKPIQIETVQEDRLGSVELRDVWLRYPEGALALQRVNLRIEPGEFIFIVGPTGSGKSSLLKLLNRELQATSGEVHVDGLEITNLSRQRVPYLRRRMGVVYQDFRLLPDRNVAENLAFAMHVVGMAAREIRIRTKGVMELVGLTGKEKSYPNQLSGGEQQRVAIARSIVNAPHLLIADEPTGSLDPATSLGIIGLLQQINATGTTLIIATHDRAIVDQMRRRVIALEHGRLVADEERASYDLEVLGERTPVGSGPTGY